MCTSGVLPALVLMICPRLHSNQVNTFHMQLFSVTFIPLHVDLEGTRDTK